MCLSPFDRYANGPLLNNKFSQEGNLNEASDVSLPLH